MLVDNRSLTAAAPIACGVEAARRIERVKRSSPAARVPWFVKEGATAQLRCEVFNLFNRVNFTNVVSDLPNSLFGKSTAQSLPRSVTLGVRVQF